MNQQRVFLRDSPICRVGRENALLLGGPAAAILQVAHPQVAAGVAAHSDFRRDSLGRLHRTLDAVYTVTFGTLDEANAVRERIAALHSRVRGADPWAYSAFSPDAQMWVLATLIAVGTDVFERLVRPIEDEERQRHYREMRVFGEFFGLPRSFGPSSSWDFAHYYRQMLDGNLLASHHLCRDVARAIIAPRFPLWFHLAARPMQFLTIELLPSPVRERLGFRSTPSTRAAMRAAMRFVRSALPFLPEKLRYTPKYLLARRGRIQEGANPIENNEAKGKE